MVTALEDWRIAALTPEALDQKTVQLMVVRHPAGADLGRRRQHARAAIKAGATLQELHACAAIAALFRGVAAFNLARRDYSYACFRRAAEDGLRTVP